MRQLILLRGTPASGKSTFIKEKELEQYTLSADKIRLLFQSPVMNEDGGLTISQKNDDKVWKFLFELLEERMKRGEFTIIDATHSKTEMINRYKKLAQKYRYRVTVVDFSHIPLDVALERNRQRDSYKFVPEYAIENIYERMSTEKIPSWVNTIKPEEFDNYLQYKPLDFSEWKKIHVIGDIQGCYTVLKEYIGNDLKEDELYIFAGDLLDRGIENRETMDFFLSIKNNENVIFIEGNHDKWFWFWANDEEDNIKNKGFLNETKAQLEHGHDKKSLNEYKKEVRNLYRKFRQVAYFKYYDKTFLVTHGGLSKLPENLMFVSTEQFISGVGSYETDIDYAWEKNTNKNKKIIQIHGHRNLMRLPVKASENSYNLEGQVEFGGYLRIVTLTKDNIETHEVKNNVFKKSVESFEQLSKEDITVKELVEYMREHELIREKELENGISSFNFTRCAFSDKKWDDLNTRARGLFVNTNDYTIASRSYDKFFNVNEVKSTKLNMLADNLKFPVHVYEKVNGYLGTVGYNSTTDELLFTSKSEINGEHAQWLKELFIQKFSKDELDAIKKFIKDNNVSLIFEVIKHKEDPHIIKYNKDDIVLLDIVYREIEFKKFDYNNLLDFALNFNFKIKSYIKTFGNWVDFYKWYRDISEDWSIEIEGYVIEDNNGFMTKIKLPYYNFWKQMRGLKDKVAKKHEHTVRGGSLYTSLHNKVFYWMKQQDREWLKSASIIEVRDKFYEEMSN